MPLSGGVAAIASAMGDVGRHLIGIAGFQHMVSRTFDAEDPFALQNISHFNSRMRMTRDREMRSDLDGRCQHGVSAIWDIGLLEHRTFDALLRARR